MALAAWINVGFLVALQFLTSLPVPLRRLYKPEEMGRAMSYYPLVGLLIGILLAGLDYTLRQMLLPAPAVGAAVLASWVLLTGGLHLDGLMDVCDGVFSQATPERRLEVMRDTRAGSYGVLGAACILLLKYGFILSLPVAYRSAALLLAPVMGRWTMVLAAAGFPSARPSGMGHTAKMSVGVRQVLVATVTALAAAAAFARGPGLALAAALVLLAWLLGRYFQANLGGLTGDTYGFINENIEAAALFAAVLAPTMEGLWYGP